MKYIDADKLKAEIERLKSIEYPCDNSQQATGFFNALDRMTDFLDTLEEPDRPEPYTGKYDEAYLNEKIKKATESWKGVDVDAMLAECRGYDEEKSEKPMNQEGLEEEYKDYVVNDPVYSKLVNRNAGLVIARHFAQWQKQHDAELIEIAYNDGITVGMTKQKEQMMKEAVCYIAQPDIVATGNIVIPFIRIGYTALSRYGIKVGDKVRIIIVKEDKS